MQQAVLVCEDPGVLWLPVDFERIFCSVALELRVEASASVFADVLGQLSLGSCLSLASHAFDQFVHDG